MKFESLFAQHRAIMQQQELVNEKRRNLKAIELDRHSAVRDFFKFNEQRQQALKEYDAALEQMKIYRDSEVA